MKYINKENGAFANSAVEFGAGFKKIVPHRGDPNSVIYIYYYIVIGGYYKESRRIFTNNFKQNVSGLY